MGAANPDIDVTEQLQIIDEAYKQLLAIVGSMTEEEMLAPRTVGIWSGKDVVADIAGWEAEVTRYILELDAGNEAVPQPAEEDGTWDQFNQRNVDLTSDMSLEQVLTYFDDIHRRFIEVSVASPNTPWPAVVRITKTHYEEHHDDLTQIPEVVSSRD